MKKLFPLFMTVLSLVIFFSCEKEDLTIKSLTLDQSTLSLTINETHQFVVTITPTNLQAPVYIWTTSNKNIVSVDDKGEIKAISVGEATITVFNPDKTLQSSCKVSVQPINATAISLDVKSLDLLADEEIVLTYKITPENTTNKQITWSSADINIATVDNTGKVKAIGVGETKITAKTNNLISDVCDVKVNPVKATTISLSQNSISMEMSDKQTLSVSFTPVNTTNKKIIWSSSNSSIATVSETGEITGISEGTAIITVTSEDGGFSASCNVNVKLKGIVLSQTSIETIPNQNEIIWVSYSTNDEAYTNATWNSSNPTVANVKSNGKGVNSAMIITYNTGTTIITATSADGQKIASCLVTVKEIFDYVTLTANPKSAKFQTSQCTYIIGCKLTNPTNCLIYIDAVVLLNDSNFGLQNATPVGYRTLKNGSSITYFDEITLYGNYSTCQAILSTYKVMLQYSIEGQTYQIWSNVNVNKFGVL